MLRPLLETVELIVGYGRRAVLQPVSATLPAGRLICLLGANGSGKSTLLRTLSGLQSPLAGEIRLLQQPISRLSAQDRAKRLALVLTDRTSTAAMQGTELVALGRHPYTGWSGRLSQRDKEAVADALAETGSVPLGHRQIAELSDGERQRLLVARALAQEPRVLILDEATAFLDLPRRVELMHLLRRIARSRQIAVLLSTHDLELALRYADDLWLLHPDGFLQVGAPEDLVLSGEFAAAFQRDGLLFDLDRGTLHVEEDSIGQVSVAADGLVGRWLGHAVRRAGFDLVEGAPLRITSTGTGFRMTREGQEAVDVGTVQALVDLLRQDATCT